MAGIDMHHSRRGMFNLCAFWVRDESGVGNSDEYIYKTKPTGYFYAKEERAEYDDTGTIMGAFMVHQHSILLRSNDDLTGITKNSLVRYRGNIWRVDNVQKETIIKESQYLNKPKYYWYIQIVR